MFGISKTEAAAQQVETLEVCAARVAEAQRDLSAALEQNERAEKTCESPAEIMRAADEVRACKLQLTGLNVKMDEAAAAERDRLAGAEQALGDQVRAEEAKLRAKCLPSLAALLCDLRSYCALAQPDETNLRLTQVALKRALDAIFDSCGAEIPGAVTRELARRKTTWVQVFEAHFKLVAARNAARQLKQKNLDEMKCDALEQARNIGGK